MEGHQIKAVESVIHNGSFGKRTLRFETGRLAQQADGAVAAYLDDDSMILSTTTAGSSPKENYDFFPLTVDFNEKMYAAGRIPGGYLKREGRPSEKATLTARMIDRPIRPSFPDGFRNEVHIVATSLVADQVNPFDVINVMGASLAMTLGGVPFEGPLACVRIGRNVETGEFIVNPTYEERENSDLDLELGGSADFISMVEAGAEEISEDDMLAAMRPLLPSARLRTSSLPSGSRSTAPSSRRSTRSTSPSRRSRSASSPTTTRWQPPFATPTSSPVSVRSRL